MRQTTRKTVHGAVRPPRTVRATPRLGGITSSDPVESRRDKFIRQMATRTGNLHNIFSNLRKLADREYYPHTQHDLETLMAFLRQEIDLTEDSFKLGREISGGIRLPKDGD